MKGITVIIPTFNRASFISEAIESVLNQEINRDIEILISDDGSTDETVMIAKSYGHPVKVILKPIGSISQGASSARNRGIINAANPYICFLDSDDYFLPDHLAKMTATIESKPNLGFAFSRILETNEHVSKDLYKPWSKEEISERDISHLIVSDHKVVQTNGFIFKAEVFTKAGLFDESLKNCEDTDLWMRISEIYKGAFCNHFGAVLRLHGNDQLTDKPKELLLSNHLMIFNAAKKRYYELGLSDRYRIMKLNYMIWKYRLCQIPILKQLYILAYRYKMKKNANVEWNSLSYFTNR